MIEFKRIPTIFSPDELLEMAFGRASKAPAKAGDKVKIVSKTIRDYFKKILKRTPSLDKLPSFYFELIDAIASIAKLKKALAALQWASNTISRLEREYIRKIRRAPKNEKNKYRKEFYGRVVSILEQIEDQLEFLAGAREKLKNLPSIRDEFTIVISGAPNVGKSTFLRAITTAKPRVESYPFTTQQILLGYFESKHEEYQVIDTPGLLDRPIEKRNPVEKQAILALKHLADVVLFIFDPSERCGFQVEEQMRIYWEMSRAFDAEVIPVINKADLLSEEDIKNFLAALGRNAYLCSAEKKIGVGEVVKKIVEIREISESK
ncbi:MAG: GTPase [Methanobacteriota archaeon]